MSLVSQAEAAAEVAVPQLRAAKVAALCFAAVLVIALVAFLVWLIFIRPHQAQVAAETAKVEAVTSTATAGASQDAVRIVTVHDKEVDHIQTITEGGVRAVQSAADAGTHVPAVHDAFVRSVCLLDAERDYPGCPAVPGAGQGVGDAGSNAGSTSTGR